MNFEIPDLRPFELWCIRSRGLSAATGDSATPLEAIYSAMRQDAYVSVPPRFVEKLPQLGK